MGATNNIKETNITLQLAGKSCDQCSQKFTEQDIKNNNFDFFFYTTNEVELISTKELEKTDRYYPFGRTGYHFSIWIRSIEHQDCPDTEPCQKCDKSFLVEIMINPEGDFDYYCFPCYQQISKDYEEESKKTS